MTPDRLCMKSPSTCSSISHRQELEGISTCMSPKPRPRAQTFPVGGSTKHSDSATPGRDEPCDRSFWQVHRFTPSDPLHKLKGPFEDMLSHNDHDTQNSSVDCAREDYSCRPASILGQCTTHPIPGPSVASPEEADLLRKFSSAAMRSPPSVKLDDKGKGPIKHSTTRARKTKGGSSHSNKHYQPRIIEQIKRKAVVLPRQLIEYPGLLETAQDTVSQAYALAEMFGISVESVVFQDLHSQKSASSYVDIEQTVPQYFDRTY